MRGKVACIVVLLVATLPTGQSDSAVCADDVFDTSFPFMVVACFINLYPTDDEVTSVILTESGSDVTVASRGGVKVTLITGDFFSTESVASGYENPQCSVWDLPVVASCVDDPSKPDYYYTAAPPQDSTECVIFADVGINTDDDPEDEYGFSRKAVMIVDGACSTA